MPRVIARTYPDLKTWRRAQGFGQRQAATLLGISQTYYSRLERREQVATRETAARIIDLTGVPLETITGVA